MDITPLLSAQGGAATAADLARWRLSRRDIDRLVRAGELVRVRRGAYLRPLPETARPEQRHALRAIAVLRTLPDDAALAAVSALTAWGVPVIGDPGDRVHIVRARWSRGMGHGPDVFLHSLRGAPAVPLPAASRWPGAAVVPPELAALQEAAQGRVLRAKAALDALLHADPGRSERLPGLAALLPARGQRQVRRAIALADSRIESPGESWLHLVLLDLGYLPELQVTIRDGREVVARADFVIGRTIIEFDGAVKYRTEADWVAEKRREHRLRSLGFRVVRVMWSDLRDPARVAAILAEAA